MIMMTSHDFSYAKRGQLVRIIYLIVSIIYSIPAYFRYRGLSVAICYHLVKETQMISFERQMRWIAGRVGQLSEVLNEKGYKGKVYVTFDDAYECLTKTAIRVNKVGV